MICMACPHFLELLLKDVDGQQVNWMKIKCIRVTKGETDEIEIKESYDEEYSKVKHKIRKTRLSRVAIDASLNVGRRGVVGSTLAFGSIGHGFESEHRLFSHHSASAFSKLKSLAKCSLDDSVRRLL